MVNQDTINLVKSFEGLYLEAYKDPVGIVTIGYGTIRYPNGKAVQMGEKISKAQAEEYLRYELDAKANVIKPLITASLNENQFGALTSFAYNVGQGNLKSSTLLKKVNANPSDLSIESAFMLWNKAKKGSQYIVLPGLTRRRKAESTLYFKPLI